MYKELIKSKGISLTEKRIALIRVLDEANKPLTIEDIKRQLDISVDTSTIYRSLKTLVDVGLIYQTDFRNGVSYFEFQKDGDHHHHIVCTSCKSRSPIQVCVDEHFSALENQTGYTITNHIFEVFGLCKDCSK